MSCKGYFHKSFKLFHHIIFFYFDFLRSVPEIGEQPTGKNPLFNEGDNLPEFNNFTIENCIAGIGHQALQLEKQIKNVEKSLTENDMRVKKDAFVEVIDPIEEAQSTLEATWGIAKTIYLGNSSLMPTKSYMSIHDRARKAASFKYNSRVIFEALQAIPEISDSDKSRVLEKFTLEGKLNGLGLKEKERLLLYETLGKLANKKSTFQAHVSKSIEIFKFQVQEPNLMMEFPPHLLQGKKFENCSGKTNCSELG